MEAAYLPAHGMLDAAVYFPFEAELEEMGEITASELADVLQALRSDLNSLLIQSLDPDIAVYFEQLGLFENAVLVTEIHCSKISIKGLILTGLGFLGGSIMQPAIQQSEPGRAAIAQVTRALDAAYELGIDTARDGAQRVATAFDNRKPYSQQNRFTIEKIWVEDNRMRIIMSRRPPYITL